MTQGPYALETTLRLIVYASVCTALATTSALAGQQAGAVFKIEIVDVNNNLAPSGQRKSDRGVLLLDAKSPEDKRFVEQMWNDYGPVFGFKDWNNFGPDSSYRQIRITHQGRVWILSSWHPLVEQNPGTVAASYGVTMLGGRSRSEFLETDNQEYVAKRSAFDAIAQLVLRRRQ